MVTYGELKREATIHDGATLVGTVALGNADPSMGVAMGVFNPTGLYDPALHANDRGGDDVRGYPFVRDLTLRTEGELWPVEISLMDYSKHLPDDERAREVHVFFKTWQDWERFFARAEDEN